LYASNITLRLETGLQEKAMKAISLIDWLLFDKNYILADEMVQLVKKQPKIYGLIEQVCQQIFLKNPFSKVHFQFLWSEIPLQPTENQHYWF